MLTINSGKIDTTRVSEIFKQEVTREAKRLRILDKPLNKQIDPVGHAHELLKVISNVVCIDVDTLKSRSREQAIVEARHIYFFILMYHSGAQISKTEAAMVLNRDHATCIHSLKVCENLMQTDARFANKFNKCLTVYKSTFTTSEHFVTEYNNHPQL